MKQLLPSERGCRLKPGPLLHRHVPFSGLFLGLFLVRRILLDRNKPPVTTGLIALQSLLFLLRNLPLLAPDSLLESWAGGALRGLAQTVSLGELCMSANNVLYQGQWYRVATSMVAHANDLHLMWNMLSLWNSGVVLEGKLGSVMFGLLVLLLGLTAHLLFCAIVWVGSLVGYMEGMRQCPVGFSGVLFGLIVVLNLQGYARGWTTVMGVRVPTAYAHWVILIMTQIITPNASFLGHLCGILAGLFYVFVSKRMKKSLGDWTWLRGRGYEDFGSGTTGGAAAEPQPHAD